MRRKLTVAGARRLFCARRDHRRMRRRVPGNAVAEVDGTAIEKDDFEHWLERRRRSPAAPRPRCPMPPDYTDCIAQRKKAAAKPARRASRSRPTRTTRSSASSSTSSCATRCCGLLISFEWIEREAEDQGVKVTDAEVKKSLRRAEEAVVPQGSRLPEVPQGLGQDQRGRDDARPARHALEKIRDKVTKGKDKVTDQQIEDYYNKNKAQFAQPERRDLRIVLTKTEGQGRAGQGGARVRRVVQGGRQEVLDRRRLQGAGRQAARRRQGPAGEGVRRRRSSRPRRARSTARSRRSSASTSSRSTRSRKASQQSLEEAKTTIKQVLASQNQQKALDDFVKDFRKKWKDKTECRDELRHAGLQERAGADADADRRAPVQPAPTAPPAQ